MFGGYRFNSNYCAQNVTPSVKSMTFIKVFALYSRVKLKEKVATSQCVFVVAMAKCVHQN